jgi:hypothetical protein
MKDIGRMDSEMEKESSLIKMELLMMVTGKWGKNQDLENLSMAVRITMKATG